MNNLETIKYHNQDYEQGLVSFKLGINQFTDKFTHEVIAERNGFNETGSNEINVNINLYSIEYMSPESIVVPAMMDWRTMGAVTEVKDQGKKR